MGKSKAQIAANKDRVRQELPLNVQDWSRQCVLPYPLKFEASIDLLLEAARLASQGGEKQVDHAKQLIGAMNDAEMRSWFDDLAQNSGTVRLDILKRKHERVLGKSSIKRPTKKQELEIIAEHGFHCRYCGIRLVPNEQFKKLQAIVGYDILPNRSKENKKTRNIDIHGIWLLTRATVDHVEPVSGGGLDVNRRENLVACCWPCNYAKWKYTIKDLEIDNPTIRPPKKTDWRGLTDILP